MIARTYQRRDMFEKPSVQKDLDWLTVALYGVLVIAGWTTIFSAVYELGDQNLFSFESFRDAMRQTYIKQLLWIGLAALLAWVILSIDAYFISQTAFLTYGLMIFLLILVLFIGKEVKGAKAWFDLGIVQLQPAEFAKFATALALAKYLSKPNRKLMQPQHFGLTLLIMLTPAVLILLENETGSALVFAAFAVALYREGLPNALMIAALSAIGLLVGTLLSLDNIWVLISQLVYFWALVAILLVINAYLRLRPDYRPPVLVPLLEVVVVLIGLGLFWFFLSDAVAPVSAADGTYNVPPFVQIPDFQGALKWLVVSLLGLSVLALGLFIGYKRSYIRFVWLFLMTLISVGAVAGLDFFVKGVLQPHQQTRLQVLINPDADTQGAGYHVANSKTAIGAGSWTGKGYLDGNFTKLRYVPDRHTDFIFCTFAEEWGWVGSTLLFLTFGALMLRIVYLAERQRSRFSRVYGYCVLSIFLFHFLVNIGMTMGVMPVIGIPLPFFSYGGSSLFAFTILLFIFLKLDVYRTQKLVH